MSFDSVLFEDPDGSDRTRTADEPDFFADLMLNQVVASVTAGREEYALEPLFHTPLHEVEAVRYRHDALRDLETVPLREAVQAFAESMRAVRQRGRLADRMYYSRQQQRWFLDAVRAYCDAVAGFDDQLGLAQPGSRAFASLRDYVAGYAQSDRFTVLAAESEALGRDLEAITYTVHIKGNRVQVGSYGGQTDVAGEVDQAFAKFRRGAVKDYRVSLPEPADMNHVEAQILDLVAKLHPDAFAALDDYCARNRDFVDATLRRFDREVQFYLAYLEYIEPLGSAGLSFCLPGVSVGSKAVHAAEAFDLALAAKLAREEQVVVSNDFVLNEPERILVVSGPNNGGKTTFARMVGQLHYLASLGLPVPALDAQLLLPDRVFSHFEREEQLETLRGRFEDELVRIHEILRRATGRSLLIMNESFGSTTLHDARSVGSAVLEEIIELDALCVFVTFVDELASLSPTTVSMMSTVVPEDPAIRTFKVVRKPADGLAYAAALAEKYGLTFDAIQRRLAG
jgi:DNA mismatch repair ATPase MutS